MLIILVFMPLARSTLFYWITDTPKFFVFATGVLISLIGLFVKIRYSYLNLPYLNLPVVTLLFVFLLSALFSAHKKTSVFGFYSLSDGLIFYFLAAGAFFAIMQLDRESTEKLTDAALLPLFPIALIAFYEAFFANYYRSAATMANPVYLGSYSALILPIALSKFSKESEMLKQIYYLASVFLCALLILLSYTRISILLMLALAAYAIFKPDFLDYRKKFALVALAFATFIIAAVHGSYYSPQGPQLSERLGNLTGVSAYATRIEMAKSTFKIIVNYPLMGGGIGTYTYTSLPYTTKKLVDMEPSGIFTDEDNIMKGEPHNIILTITSTTGIIGLTAFLWLVFTLTGIYLRKILKAKKADTEKRFIEPFAIIIIFFLIIKLTQPNQVLDWVFFWVACGMIAGYPSKEPARKVQLKIPIAPCIAFLILSYSWLILAPVFAEILLAKSYDASNHLANYNKTKTALIFAPWNDYIKNHQAESALYIAKQAKGIAVQIWLQEAANVSEKAVAGSPSDIYFRMTAAKIYTEMGGNLSPAWYGFAEKHLRKTVDLYPAHPLPKKLLEQNIMNQREVK